MNSLSCSEAIELFSGVLSDEIDADQAMLLESHLASCKSCCDLAAAFARQDVGILHLASQASTKEVIERLLRELNGGAAVPPRVRSAAPIHADPGEASVRTKPAESGAPVPAPWRGARARRIGGFLWGLLAASLMVGAIYLLVGDTSVPGKGGAGAEKGRAVIARLERVDGEVRLIAHGVEKVVQPGLALLSGQSLRTVGSGGTAIVRYPDSTRIEVGVDSELCDIQDDPESGKQLRLIRGTLLASVSKQPDNRPMIIRSPQAEAAILGTTLRVTVDSNSTRLKVLDGHVILKRLADGKSVTVPSGHQAVAALDVALIPRKTIGEWGVEVTEGWDFSGDGTANVYSFAGRGGGHRPGGVVLTSDQSWDLSRGPLDVSFQWDIDRLTTGFVIGVSLEHTSATHARPQEFPRLSCYHNGMILPILDGKDVQTGFPEVVRFPAKVSAILHADRTQSAMNTLRAESAHTPITGPVRVKISIGFIAEPAGFIRFQGSLRDVRVTQSGR